MGIVYFITIGKHLLPRRKDLIESVSQDSKKYLAEVKVTSESKLIGKSIEQGGPRELKDFYLVEIIRNSEAITPVPPNIPILENDILLFAGDTEEIKHLITLDPGFVLADGSALIPPANKISEVVISFNSSLVGKSIKSSGFRSRYDAAVLAVHRNGEKLKGKLGKIILHAGDVLLVSAGAGF